MAMTPVPVRARKLEPLPAESPAVDDRQGSPQWRFVAAIAALCILLVAGGFVFRRGLP
jgi:hypothetical protein